MHYRTDKDQFASEVQLNERAPFRVVEMGAGARCAAHWQEAVASCSLSSLGSGQLAYDTQQCVRTNALGLAPSVWRRWTAAFERPGLSMLCQRLLVPWMFTKVYHNGKASPAVCPCVCVCARRMSLCGGLRDCSQGFLRFSSQHRFAGLLRFANGSNLEDFGQCLEMRRARLESQEARCMWDGSTL